MQPILTIAIPTYNRKDKLEKCIECVLEQIKDSRVELLVSDNASVDGTEEMVREKMGKHLFISYYRNKENIGPDRNFLNCYEKAHGVYVLLLGDDDLLLPGALEKILNALENNPSFLYLNTCTLLSNSTTIEYTAPRFEENGIKKYEDKSAFIKDIGIYITFVSALVLKTQYIKDVQDKEQYIGTYFIQSHIALETLKNDGTYMILTENCIAATGNETVRYDFYYVWGEQYYRVLFETGVQCGIRREVLEELYLEDLNNTLKQFVIYYRKSCKNSAEWDANHILNNLKRHPYHYRKFYFLTKAPMFLVEIYCLMQRVLLKLSKICHSKR